MKLGTTITLEAASSWFRDEKYFIKNVRGIIPRCIPTIKTLQQDSPLVEVLRQAVENCGIVCRDVSDVPGLEDAYKMGYLHASSEDQEGTLYAFPSPFHQR